MNRLLVAPGVLLAIAFLAPGDAAAQRGGGGFRGGGVFAGSGFRGGAIGVRPGFGGVARVGGYRPAAIYRPGLGGYGRVYGGYYGRGWRSPYYGYYRRGWGYPYYGALAAGLTVGALSYPSSDYSYYDYPDEASYYGYEDAGSPPYYPYAYGWDYGRYPGAPYWATRWRGGNWR